MIKMLRISGHVLNQPNRKIKWIFTYPSGVNYDEVRKEIDMFKRAFAFTEYLISDQLK